jgi:hypothetical protein
MNTCIPQALDRVARKALQDTETEWAQALGERAYVQLRTQLQRLLPVAEASNEPQAGPFADLSDHRPLPPASRGASRKGIN